MITLRAESRHPKGGQYVAAVVGRHPRWTFERDFVGRKSGNRHETTEADLDAPGLYEICNIDPKGHKYQQYVLLLDFGRRLTDIECAKQDAMRIARSLDDGLAISQIVRPSEDGRGYEILTAAQRRAADVARSVERIADECWAILQALPTQQAKRVLKELRSRLTPPTEPKPQPPVEPEATP